MITSFLLTIFCAPLSAAIGLLPSFDLGHYLSGFSLAVSNMAALNYWLPIAEVFAVVLAVLALGVPMATATIALWLWAQMRGSSSVG